MDNTLLRRLQGIGGKPGRKDTAEGVRALGRLQKLHGPLPKYGLNFLLIFFCNEFVEARGDFTEYGFNTSFDAIFGVKLEFVGKSTGKP